MSLYIKSEIDALTCGDTGKTQQIITLIEQEGAKLESLLVRMDTLERIMLVLSPDYQGADRDWYQTAHFLKQARDALTLDYPESLNTIALLIEKLGRQNTANKARKWFSDCFDCLRYGWRKKGGDKTKALFQPQRDVCYQDWLVWKETTDPNKRGEKAKFIEQMKTKHNRCDRTIHDWIKDFNVTKPD